MQHRAEYPAVDMDVGGDITVAIYGEQLAEDGKGDFSCVVFSVYGPGSFFEIKGQEPGLQFLHNRLKLFFYRIRRSFRRTVLLQFVPRDMGKGRETGFAGEDGAGKSQTGALPAFFAVSFGKELENFHGVAEFCHLRTLLFCFLACPFEAIIYLQYSG